MPAIGPHSFLWLAAVLFAIGLSGLMLRRNILTMLMCVQLMLSAVSLTFVAFSRHLGDVRGQVMALLVLAIGGAQLAVGLAVVVGVYRDRGTLEADQLDSLREET